MNNKLNALFDRIRNKDEEALAQLISYYKSGMVAYATTIVGNSCDAEAIFFYVIENIYFHPENVTDATRLSGYLRTAIRNGAYNYNNTAEKKHTVNETDLGDEEFIQSFHCPDESPEETLDKKELRIILIDILKQMDPRYGRPLYEQYYNDLGLSDIAKKLQIPRTTVMGRLQQGKKMLRGYQHIVQERYGYTGYEHYYG